MAVRLVPLSVEGGTMPSDPCAHRVLPSLHRAAAAERTPPSAYVLRWPLPFDGQPPSSPPPQPLNPALAAGRQLGVAVAALSHHLTTAITRRGASWRAEQVTLPRRAAACARYRRSSIRSRAPFPSTSDRGSSDLNDTVIILKASRVLLGKGRVRARLYCASWFVY